MELKCLFGHRWNDCKCTRCGKVRDEQHDWDLCKGKCKRCGKSCEVKHNWNYCTCTVCGKRRNTNCCNIVLEGTCVKKCTVCGRGYYDHDFAGLCACRKCGLKSNGRHDFKYIEEGSCKQKCTVCGEERIIHDETYCKCRRCGEQKLYNLGEHDFKQIKGTCTKKCSICGYVEKSHQWDYCICKICGQMNNGEYATHKLEMDYNNYHVKCKICGKLTDNKISIGEVLQGLTDHVLIDIVKKSDDEYMRVFAFNRIWLVNRAIANDIIQSKSKDCKNGKHDTVILTRYTKKGAEQWTSYYRKCVYCDWEGESGEAKFGWYTD